ncbi:alkaline phosphatase [Hathewaya histolytica]|uniref:Alkaline phosphatase n=1 Tax=Hathewaya histolytica TaxID=1498 RepID=A0A4V6KEC7_HATHI|nr:alkaline phosphatase [Hathewaya histolytica]VTQ94407.1 alkaline phosphatase [Hathewaya histolytica]
MKKSNVIIILCIISIFSLGVVLVTLKKGDKRENSYKATTSQVKNENTKENKEKKLKGNPKYVFLFIGDGNAMPQINAAENYLSAKDGNGNKPNAYKIKENKLSFTRFPVMGMTTTYAADTFITDSASAGTAISTGNKTDDGVISMGSDRKTSYKTIAEIVRESGKKVGIVSSVSIDHATPAVFYAHNKTRKNYYEIAMNMPRSDFNYFAGGGLKEPIGKNKDKPHVHEEAKKLGYKIVKTKEDFNKLSNKEEKIIAESPVLDEEQALPYEVDNSKDGITLKEFTKKGIEVLNNEKGFFMMVEGGKIDWACHANDATTSIKDI